MSNPKGFNYNQLKSIRKLEKAFTNCREFGIVFKMKTDFKNALLVATNEDSSEDIIVELN